MHGCVFSDSSSCLHTGMRILAHVANSLQLHSQSELKEYAQTYSLYPPRNIVTRSIFVMLSLRHLCHVECGPLLCHAVAVPKPSNKACQNCRPQLFFFLSLSTLVHFALKFVAFGACCYSWFHPSRSHVC